ncbi:MAG: MFS transporter [Chloroflexota bacterium]|nr:MFS transporter [Chloroflexota bacterium]
MSLQSVRDAARSTIEALRRGWALLAIAFLVDAAFLFVFLIVLQTYLPESLGKSDAIAGYALAAFGGAKLMTQLASGFVSDRLGARRAVIGGIALLLVADVSMLPLAHIAPWLIIGAAAVEGLGSSVTWPAVYASADGRFAAGQKGRFTALLTLASGAALLVALGGGNAVYSFVPFNIAMLAPIGAVSMALVLAVGVALRTPAHEAEMRRELPTPGEFGGVLRHPQRAMFAAIVLTEAAALGALTATYRAYGRDVLHASLTHQNALIIPAVIIGGLAVIPGGVIADRIGTRRVLVPGFAITGVCLMLLARWSDPLFVIFVAGVAGAGFGLAVPSIAATMMSLAGSAHSRGGVIGWFMTMDGIGHAIGPAMAGVLLATLGAQAVLLASGGLFIAAAYLALASRVGERERQELFVVGTQVESLIGGGS